MTIRLPRVSIKTVPVTCRLDADLQSDLQAYAAAYEAQYGEAIAFPVLITTIVRDSLQRDQDFMRQHRQAAAAPQARATPASSAPRPHGQDSRDGALSRPSHGTHGDRKTTQEEGKTEEITAATPTPRMRTFLPE